MARPLSGKSALLRAKIVEALFAAKKPLCARELSQTPELTAIKADSRDVTETVKRMMGGKNISHPVRRIVSPGTFESGSATGTTAYQFKYYHNLVVSPEKDEPMTPAKQQRILEGQSHIAQKVFQAVPIKEAWIPGRIKDALFSSTRSNADLHVIRGCLSALRDAGLVREPLRGMFQRVEVSQPEAEQQLEQIGIPAQVNIPSFFAPQPTEPQPAMNTEANAATDPLVTLADLANQMVTMANEFSDNMRRLASKVEEAALDIAAQQADNEKTMAIVRQFQALMKTAT